MSTPATTTAAPKKRNIGKIILVFGILVLLIIAIIVTVRLIRKNKNEKVIAGEQKRAIEQQQNNPYSAPAPAPAPAPRTYNEPNTTETKQNAGKVLWANAPGVNVYNANTTPVSLYKTSKNANEWLGTIVSEDDKKYTISTTTSGSFIVFKTNNSKLYIK